jgi:hypothetical protein
MQEGFSRRKEGQIWDKGNNFSSEMLWLSEVRNTLAARLKCHLPAT